MTGVGDDIFSGIELNLERLAPLRLGYLDNLRRRSVLGKDNIPNPEFAYRHEPFRCRNERPNPKLLAPSCCAAVKYLASRGFVEELLSRLGVIVEGYGGQCNICLSVVRYMDIRLASDEELPAFNASGLGFKKHSPTARAKGTNSCQRSG